MLFLIFKHATAVGGRAAPEYEAERFIDMQAAIDHSKRILSQTALHHVTIWDGRRSFEVVPPDDGQLGLPLSA